MADNIEKLKGALEAREARLVSVFWGPAAASMTPEERAGELLKFVDALDDGELVGAYGPWHWRVRTWAREYWRRFKKMNRRVSHNRTPKT